MPGFETGLATGTLSPLSFLALRLRFAAGGITRNEIITTQRERLNTAQWAEI